MTIERMGVSACVLACLWAVLCWPSAHAEQEAQPARADGDTQAQLINVNVCKPKYPPESLRAEEQGVTVLRMDVAASGDLRGISLLRSSGSQRLDQATIDALGQCRFRPATRAGVPIDASFTLQYKWSIAPPAFSSCAPEYPQASFAAGEQGKTVLRFRVGADGKAQDVRVVTSSGYARLDAASIEALRRCTFRVAASAASSATVPLETTVEYVWRLEDGVPVRPAVPSGPVGTEWYRPTL